ncbi:MAG: stalk domain-containing protein [Armatimonadota bacterium]
MNDQAQAFRRTAPWLLIGALALAGAGGAMAQAERVEVPANTVLRAELTQPLSSRTAQEGDRVAAVLSATDTSELPVGTRFEGTLTEVRRASEDRPAVLDMDFQRAILPDGQTLSVRGDLASLSDENVRYRAGGRVEARRGSGDGGFDWKWVGYGAGGGAVLGEIFGDNFLRGALLGGLGGAIYGYLNRDRDRGQYREVELSRGTELGIRLDRQLAFTPGENYIASRDRAGERVLGSRQETRGSRTRLLIDERAVDFGTTQPLRINGVLFVPLRPVSRDADWTLQHTAGADDFTLTTPRGEVRATVGERTMSQGDNTHTLTEAPVLVGDEVYVPVELLGRVDDRRIRWERQRGAGTTPRGGSVNGGTGRVAFDAVIRGLAAIDFTDFRGAVASYEIVDLKRSYSLDEATPLMRLIDQNSGARRNQLLMTRFLRDTRLIRDAQVVGADPERRIIYIY